MHIERLWRNVSAQLAREHDGSAGKFKFKGAIPEIKRYSKLAGSIDWLVSVGLIIKVSIVNNGQLPFSAYTTENTFKLYVFDVGLLGALSDLSPKSIMEYEYGSYKGYFAENLVLQEIKAATGKTTYSWMKNTSEVEFIIDSGQNIYPVEVKAGINTKAKSLKVYKELYSPKKTFLLSGCNLNLRNGLYPLYFASKLMSFCE